MIFRKKKLRGRKSKQREAELKRWQTQNAYKRVVRVSQITADGFWLHTYKGNHYVSREKFPWFKGASDKEIQDVTVLLCRYDENDNGLEWSSLDLHFRINFFAANPTLPY